MLPAYPDQCEALPHQQAVAEMLLQLRVSRAPGPIEIGDDCLAAPVAHLQQRRTRTAPEILRLQHHEVCPRLNQSVGVARGLVEVHDAGVHRVGGVKHEVDPTDEFFVRPYRSKGPSLQHVGSPIDHDPYHLRL